MKKTISFLLAIMMLFSTVCATFSVQAADDSDGVMVVDLPIVGTFHQTEARKLLGHINSFRTSNPWYYDTDGSKKYIGNQAKLTYDYDLEQAAMLRAAEIAVSFGHTRPNTYPWYTVDSNMAGENIASGSYGSDYETAYGVFIGWREDNYGYSGQGHRRNMLGESFTRVGCACIEVDGYYYWVQEFGRGSNTSKYEAPNDSKCGVYIEVATDMIQVDFLDFNSKAISLKLGAAYTLPYADVSFRIAGRFPSSSFERQLVPNWRIGGNIVSVNGETITATTPGTVTAYADFSFGDYEKSVPVKITVQALSKGWTKENGNWYYSKGDGKIVTYWQKIGGKWYYFNSQGVMKTGWLKAGGKWYFLTASGAMATGWAKTGGKWYYFNSSGVMQVYWQKIGGKWYYFNGSGDMKTGWLKSGGKWYYLDASGAMLTNTSRKIGKKTYKFNSSGVCTNP